MANHHVRKREREPGDPVKERDLLDAPAAEFTLWKMTRIAAKSRNVIRNMPAESSANDIRYWSCERTRAEINRT
jgi:hypothetical protein